MRRRRELPGLLQIVDDAHAKGINLKIVLLDHNPPNDTPLRDISTVVGADYHDATVLTLSPNYVGSYSTHFPRVTLEAGEDIAKTGNPVVSAQHFLNELNAPEFPWTGLTIFLLLAVLGGGRRDPFPAVARQASSNHGGFGGNARSDAHQHGLATRIRPGRSRRAVPARLRGKHSRSPFGHIKRT